MKESRYSRNLTAYLHDNFITICAKSWRGGYYEIKRNMYELPCAKANGEH